MGGCRMLHDGCVDNLLLIESKCKNFAPYKMLLQLEVGFLLMEVVKLAFCCLIKEPFFELGLWVKLDIYVRSWRSEYYSLWWTRLTELVLVYRIQYTALKAVHSFITLPLVCCIREVDFGHRLRSFCFKDSWTFYTFFRILKLLAEICFFYLTYCWLKVYTS